MTELSMFWSTDSVSPEGHQQSSYTQGHWSTAVEIMAACYGFEGVVPAYKNALEVTATGANTISVNTGGGIVDGKIYANGAALPVNIPSAVGGGYTRVDWIVLRCNWAAYTVSVYRIAGTDAAAPSTPSIVETPGTTYDIPLATVLVNTGGTVTVTDQRVFAASL